jgi:hypothetical protein
VVDHLSRFDAPTGFAAGVNSVTASLNRRKEFLSDLGVLNRVGLRQDGLELRGSGEVAVGGVLLSEVDATLRDRGLGRLTLIPTSTFRRKLGDVYPELSRADLRLINPAPVPGLLNDKGRQYWELYGGPVPVPPWQPLGHYASRSGPEIEALERDFVAGAPLVLKARDSAQGRNVWFYPGGVEDVAADWLGGTAPDALLDAPERFLLQYAVPHECDKRVLAAGATPVAGENRYGSSDTDKSNLNLVETDGGSLRAAATELLGMGAVEPLAMDRIDPAVERAVGDLHGVLSGLTPSRVDELHSWIGWDLLVVDPGDDRLDAVPDAVVEGLFDERYRTRRGRYLVFGEGNLSPGSKERYVNAVAHGREGLRRDSAANLLAYGDSVSRGVPFEPGIPDLVDTADLADRYGI